MFENDWLVLPSSPNMGFSTSRAGIMPMAGCHAVYPFGTKLAQHLDFAFKRSAQEPSIVAAGDNMRFAVSDHAQHHAIMYLNLLRHSRASEKSQQPVAEA